MSSPLSQFENLQKNAEFVFIVFYRGHWCPFCLAYIKSLAGIVPSIKAAGGQTVIVTAEDSKECLEIVRAKTGYKDAAISDPSNELAESLKERSLLDVAISEKKGYSHGMAQPGVLVLGKEEKALYAWAIKPSMSNLGGAKDRPSLVQIWQDVEAQMQGNKSVHGGVYEKQTFFQGIGMKLFG